MEKMLWATLLFLSLVGASAVFGADIDLPDLGASSSSVLSPAKERQIGEAIMRDIRAGQLGLVYSRDPEVNDYVAQLGARLVRYSAMPGSQIEFFVIDDPSINAMALPGGFIGIHTGLIVSAQTESELASVMAHEIAHVTQRHIARSVMSQKQSGPLYILATVFALAISGKSPNAAAAALSSTVAVATQQFLNYSREFEREADRFGFRIVERAGLNGADYASMFERMYRTTRIQDSGTFPAYIRTHPMTWERIADIQNLMGDKKSRPVPDSTGFHLVRVKLQAIRMDPKDALVEYEKQIAEKRYLREYAAHYGVALAALNGRNTAAAKPHLRWLADNKIDHPMIASLQGRSLALDGKVDESIEAYRRAVARYPDSLALLLESATTLLLSGRPQAVVDLLTPKLVVDVSDARLYGILAQAYEKLGNAAMYHAALAEGYARSANYHDAIIQMEMAQRQSGANFYDQSIQDARLREFRRRFSEMARSDGLD